LYGMSNPFGFLLICLPHLFPSHPNT
jgi:hypothetical protein